MRFPRTNEIVQVIVEVLAICAYFSGEGIIYLFGVFAMYLSIALYVSTVKDNFKRNEINLDRIGFSTIYSAFMVLTFALGFGGVLFGQVSSKIGGGRPSDITFSLAQEIRSVLPESLVPEGKGSLQGQLVHQTEKYLYVNIADQTVRLRAEDIAVILLKPPQQPLTSFLTALRQAFKLNPTKTSNDDGVPTTEGKENESGSLSQPAK